MLVGDGDTKKAVEKRAEELGLSDRVVFTGEISDPAGFYQAFDADAVRPGGDPHRVQLRSVFKTVEGDAGDGVG